MSEPRDPEDARDRTLDPEDARDRTLDPEDARDRTVHPEDARDGALHPEETLDMTRPLERTPGTDWPRSPPAPVTRSWPRERAIDATRDEGTARTLHVPAGARSGPPLPCIPDVTIDGLIGRGGQGRVYRGRQDYLDRSVAVKVLESGADSTFAERFRREAKLLAGLHHPFIVSCYHAGVNEAGQCFIVMEFIDGPDLGGWVRTNGALRTEDALALVRDVAHALEYAQTVNVIHRDVKPPNVLLEPACDARGSDGEPLHFPFRAKLADLGLARVAGDREGQVMVTAPGAVMGTPATMSLEQIDDPDSVDYRTDIYGLGCVLYYALAGKSAYGGMTPSQVFKKKAQEPPPDLRKAAPGVPSGVAKLVRSMMDGDRTKRPQSYAEVVACVERELALLAEAAPSPASPGDTRWRRPLFAGLALLGVLALGWWGLHDRAASEPVPPDRTHSETDLSELGADLGRPRGSERAEPSDRDPVPSEPRPEPSAAPRLAPRLAAGESETLFAAWEGLDDLLTGWERAPDDIWSGFEGDFSEIQAPEGGTATRALPAGAWSLAGEVRVARPYGSPESLRVQGGVRILFEPDRALLFALNLHDPKARPAGEAGWYPLRREGEAWAIAGPALTSTAFENNQWVAFRIESRGSHLGLHVGSGDGTPAWSGDLEPLELTGPATTMSLTAAGNARWRAFVLRGL